MINLEGWSIVDGRLHNSRGFASTRSLSGSGYVIVNVRGKMKPYHQVLWYLHHGYWAKEIDHIDRNKQNNNLSNLREVTRSDNNMNQRVRKDSTSGVRGVNFVAGKWQARIAYKGTRRTTNCKTKEEAIALRMEWEEELCA